MNEPTKTASSPQPVSRITKHIHIYSDNPIHDCIDRIINACESLDGDNLSKLSGLLRMQDAAEQLSEICTYTLVQLPANNPTHPNEKRPD